MKRVKLRASYVYIIFHPVYGIPIYVGKGKGKRWLDHTKRSSNLLIKRLVAKYGLDLPIVKIQQGLTDKQAFASEIALIKTIGRIKDGGSLYNMTDGGDGVTGLSVESRKKMSEARLGRKEPDWVREKKRLSHLGLKHSAEHCQAISRANTGKLVGFTHSIATRSKMSASAKLRDRSVGYSDEHAAAIAAGVTAYWEQRRQQGLPLTNRTEAGHKKHSETMQALFAKRRAEKSGQIA